MTFSLTIELGNAAMERGPDLANALCRVADFVSDFGTLADVVAGSTIRDENGNKVGSWEVTA